MDFFEKLGKRISDMGSAVAQNTKNLADTASLQKANSDNKKKIEQLYAAIGKAYYENHKNDSTAEEAAAMAEITALLAQIEENDEKIKQLKGVTTVDIANRVHALMAEDLGPENVLQST